MTTTLVIDGHPHRHSLCAALARAYAAGNDDARVLAVCDIDFDVHLRFGYTRRMPIEPDLAEARGAIREASHIVVVTPVWWRSTPAILKGFLDRALLPHEDYRYRPNGLPEGLLTGRSARMIVTSDTPLALQHLMPDTRLDQLRRGTLAFCGLKPVRVTRFAPVKGSTPQQREGWLTAVAAAGEADAARVRARDPAEVRAA